MKKVSSSRLQQCLSPFTMLFVEGHSEGGFLRHLSNHLFRRRRIRKYIGYEGHLFFENVQNVMYILEMRRKIQEKLFLSEIIVCELVPLNSLY